MRYDHYESGALYGIRYEFKKGEKLNIHAHTGTTADQAHNITVLKGSVQILEMNRGPFGAGTVFDFDNHLPHGIEALEDGTVVLNLMLHGKPASFEGYTEAQKHGEA